MSVLEGPSPAAQWGQGPQFVSADRVRFRLWAPHARRVRLVYWPAGVRAEIALSRGADGFFSKEIDGVTHGMRYGYRLDNGPLLPDPASRWQPDGVHQPSAVFFPQQFAWNDAAWRGVRREDLVIYELHIGTFTPQGTFDAAIGRLPALAELGVTALEVMPISEFPGDRNWGYDGVQLYAAQSSYGGPEGFQRFVDAAHQLGLGVLLDVVYNHFGPEGNYLSKFGPYFNARRHTPWGAALDYDSPASPAVRQFMIDNAVMWIRDFHCDGLRLDAIQEIHDSSPEHLLSAIARCVRDVGIEAGRTTVVIGETDQNDPRLVRPAAEAGIGLDGIWSDCFHHGVHAYLTGENVGYYRDFGQVSQLLKAFNQVFVLDGIYSEFFGRHHGHAAGDADRSHFVVCIQNHDQVGNRIHGDRFGTLLSWPAQRLGAVLLLLSPCTPLLFMGEEYGESRPFPFFCSFGSAELVANVRRGRRRDFQHLGHPLPIDIPDPQSSETFQAAKLSWSWPAGSPHAGLRRLYQDLLWGRRHWPALADRRHTTAAAHRLAGTAPGGDATLVALSRGQHEPLLAWGNLGAEVIEYSPAIPQDYQLLLSSDSPSYGGESAGAESGGKLNPFEMRLYGPRHWARRNESTPS